ncbi:MAG TPA: T9SS type A sorting domain-containing protein [Saprospiraceae bacterium]|nr:T9SS type A sorting domain-containing protein [Saprospiraceae bacterium]HMQ85142.1 T9SS type A sorting domain-containing protein [Saprospiraceae bacterium]
MRKLLAYHYLGILLLGVTAAQGQDFIMQGCYWSCPGDNIYAPIDSATLDFWIHKMEQQASELSYAGFSYIWMPSLQPARKGMISGLLQRLRQSGIQPLAEMDLKRDSANLDGLLQEVNTHFQIRAYSLSSSSSGNPNPLQTAQQLNQLYQSQQLPELFITSLNDPLRPDKAARWAGQVETALAPEVRDRITPRVYDYYLRESLRRACTDSTFDVRNVFRQSLRDATSITGFNVVTLVNSPTLNNKNNRPGDADDPLPDPLLAYVYTLTNNQLGLAAVFYGDYFGMESELPEYQHKKPLKDEIDQLIQAHKAYIHGSLSIDYLNKVGTDKQHYYYPGADSTQVLIYQLDGNNTAAGNEMGHKDLIVCINFSSDTLRVIHEINRSNVEPGDYFTDITGNAIWSKANLQVSDSLQGIPYALHLSCPPRSYALWIQGRAERLIPSKIALDLNQNEQFIELNWDVPFENQTLGYQIERSVNGGSFEALDWVRPLSQSDEPASYLFIDKDVFPGEDLYYRIKMVEKNGGNEYSPVQSIQMRAHQMNFELVDKPDKKGSILYINSNYKSSAEIKLYDAKGKMALEKKQSLRVGATAVELDTSVLPKGVYYVNVLIGKEKKWSERLVVF